MGTLSLVLFREEWNGMKREENIKEKDTEIEREDRELTLNN